MRLFSQIDSRRCAFKQCCTWQDKKKTHLIHNNYLNFFIFKQNLLFVWRNVEFAVNVHLYFRHWHERIIWYLRWVSIQDCDIKNFFSCNFWCWRCVNSFIFFKHFTQNGFKQLNRGRVWRDGNGTSRVWTFFIFLAEINNTLKS